MIVILRKVNVIIRSEPATFPNYQQCVRVSVKLMMTTTAAQEGVISMQNYENVGQYLGRIYHHHL